LQQDELLQQPFSQAKSLVLEYATAEAHNNGITRAWPRKAKLSINKAIESSRPI
jgi:hypothetical protein